MISLRNRNKILIIPKSFGVSVASYSFILIFVSDQINLADGVRISGTKGNKQLSKAAVTTEHKWRLESLEAHNFLRSLHGSPPLVLNKTLSEISQYYANHLLQTYLKTLSNQNGDSTFFQHNPEVGQANIGENLYYSIMKAVLDPIPASYAVLLWYEEFKDYDFTLASRKSTSDPNAKIGHLTQLLWKGTTQMGTAYASRKLPNNQTAVFVVANYFRQGNVVLTGNEKKLYLENVMPPTISEAEINAVIVSWHVKSWWKDQELRVYTPTSWQNVVLEAHNFYREKHGAQPLRLNSDLCTVNQLWTNYLLEKGLQSFNHFGGVLNKIQPNFLARLTNFGESSMYFLLEHEQVSVETVVKLWYTQGYNYDFNKLSRNSKTKTDKFE